MGGRHRRAGNKKQEGEPLRIVDGGLDADRARLDCPGSCGLGKRADDVKKLVQGKVALVLGAREPFGRDTANALTARDIDLVARRVIGGRRLARVGHGKSPRRAPGAPLQALARPGFPRFPLTLWTSRRRARKSVEEGKRVA